MTFNSKANPLIFRSMLCITQSLEGMREDALAAMEIMTSFFAAGEDIWLTLIKAKEETLDLDSASGVEEFLALYKHAEEDDLSIPILKRHAEFILAHCEGYTETAKPQELGELFSDDWTQNAFGEAVNKGIWHLTQNLFWLVLADLVLPPKKLHKPTPFMTNFKPSKDYESLLVKASKIRGQAVKAFQRRETWETSLESRTHEAYALYIASEHRAKNLSYPILSTLYERAITDTACQRFSGEQGAEETLQAFWAGYCDIAHILEAGISMELDILQWAVGSVPGSGEVWPLKNALRTKTKRQFKASQSDIEQLVPVLLACAGYDKRRYDGTDSVKIGKRKSQRFSLGIETSRRMEGLCLLSVRRYSAPSLWKCGGKAGLRVSNSNTTFPATQRPLLQILGLQRLEVSPTLATYLPCDNHCCKS
ncbi:hypothetical protein K438DRAFT_1787245 [Mycena galopus ATCC 62051]|nr:hypothetical protein K438DRAFT_1787245 [Mycena galopus ATCC 62051]